MSARDSHIFDRTTDVCICCHAPRYGVEEFRIQCSGAPPVYREYLQDGVWVRKPVVMA